jgi:PAS domain S-box-containing protein
VEYGLTQTWRELAERKRVENELRKLTRAVEQSPVSIMIADLDDNIEYVNPHFTQVTGYTFEEVVGKKTRILKTDSVPPEMYSQPDNIKAGKEWRGEFTNQRRDGSLYYESVIISPIIDLNGVATHYLTIKEDITARKKAEANLLAAHAELEQRVRERTAELQVAVTSLEKAGRAKDEFLASMSHELRTPLSGILGNAEMLQLQVYGPLTDKQINSVSAIENESRRLRELVNAILDFSKLQSGSFSTNTAPCSLGAICYSALEATADSSAKKQQQSSFSVLPDEIMIHTDERRIKQILLALLDNAVKFTPVGGKFGIDVIGDRDNHRVKITVWDTGIGVKEEDLPLLFQPFAQIDARLAREYEGTGLGLALVKQLTEVFGGNINVESVYGQGSRFTVTLPWVD